jgi:2-dehydro-3-deoxyphosphogluconate aldolase/(4S)-4-hydroxy-2-oxoglutarate aldolase
MSESATRDKKAQILELLFQQRILPLFYNDDADVSILVLKALYNAGVRTIEYTNRGEAALQNFKVLRRVCDEELKDVQLGIGTIKTGDEAKAFVDAGADYLISPGVVKAAAKVANKNGLLYIPGCTTPTDMIRAEGFGSTLVKIFPGDLLGPSYLTSVRPLFPKLKFIITGGVEPEEGNLQSWFSAGASAVGMGSKLITKQILQERDYAKITTLTQQAFQLVQSIRQ